MNIEWDQFRSTLNLNEEQTIDVRNLLNRLKDHFAEICSVETMEGGQSPVEYFAALQADNPKLDDISLEKKLIEYIAHEKQYGSNLSYKKELEESDLLTKRELDRILNDEQREALRSLDIVCLLDIETGYDPFGEKVAEKSEKIRIDRIESIRDKKYKGFFCPIPFEHISVHDNGDVYLCSPCKMLAAPVGNLTRDSFEEIWNSQIAEKVREAILDGSFRYCNKNECEYFQDHELRKKEEFNDRFHREIISQQVTVLEKGPRVIEVDYDKSCNLSCPYCRQENIVAKGRELTRLRRIHEKILGNNLKGVKRLMISGYGEPLASELQMDFLKNLDRDRYPELRIKLQTNGLLLTPERWDSIRNSHYAIDWIGISIDAATEGTYRENRGGKFEKLLQNLEFVSGLRKKNEIDAFNINFVVQANNFREMKQFIELGRKYGCDGIVFQRIMHLEDAYGPSSEERYLEAAVHMKTHPEHDEFLNELSDPIFALPEVGLVKLSEFISDTTL
jgi:MoaA/NifB/PqqE/SkfB family radical SAM enzyme